MKSLNYNHLYYFYVVATEGGITRASAKLNLTPQTISGQLTFFETQIGVALFDRKGKKMLLSEMGRLIYSHAENIFQLGDEINNILKTREPAYWFTFTVGITGVIPKILAALVLKPVLNMPEQIRLICIGGDQDSLLADLTMNKLDMVLTDRPLEQDSHIKAQNHYLRESGFSFFAGKQQASLYRKGFPQSLSGQNFLMQGKKSAARQRLFSWLEKNDISPNIVAEFDDSALTKSFGQNGHGVFAAPTLIEKMIEGQYNVTTIGRTEDVKEYYYAITAERRIKHPAILEIVNAAATLPPRPNRV